MTLEKEDLDISHVSGNAPDHIKRVLSNTTAFYANRHPDKIKGKIFVEDMQKRFKVTEVSILQKVEEPNKLEGRVAVELEVMQGAYFRCIYLLGVRTLIFVIDMLNIRNGIHGGCSAALIDM